MQTSPARMGKRLAGLGALGAAGALLAAPLAHAAPVAPAPVSAAADPSSTAGPAAKAAFVPAPSDTTSATGTTATTEPAPTTDAPTTNAPTTDAPTTDAPTTDTPTTNAPTTDAPTSTAPTTTAPAPLPTISIPTLIPLPTLTIPTAPAPAPTTTTPAPPLVPQYGSHKVKVGVQLKTGAVVPPGTSLAGAVLSTSYAGAAAQPTGFGMAPPTCTTDATGFCPDVFGPDGYLVPAGFSFTVTEVTPPTGLVAASPAQTVVPCVTAAPDPADPSLPACADVSVVLDQTGPLPLAPSQTTQAPAGQAVTIGLPADAGNGAPITSVTVTQAQHGTVSYLANAFTYQPNVGFSGRDSFTYTVHTANGDTTGTIIVNVAAAAVTTTPAAPVTSGSNPVTTATTAPTSKPATSVARTTAATTSSAAVAPVAATDPETPQSSGVLASTGASGVKDLTLGGGVMMLFGSAAVALGRRRRVPAEARRH